jgi:hypothetical protein
MTTTKSREAGFKFLLITIISSTMLLRLVGANQPPANRVRTSWPESRATQLAFFAVLEGLYRDGVGNQDVDQIIPPAEGGKPKFDTNNFVYACPLCHPAFEAFRLYRQRELFYGLKSPLDTFGHGLEPAVAARLHSPDAAERRQTIETLISRWISQRLQLMRLSESEREEITSEIQQGRKQGMSELRQTGQTTQTRTNCPICDGSFGACKLSQ